MEQDSQKLEEGSKFNELGPFNKVKEVERENPHFRKLKSWSTHHDQFDHRYNFLYPFKKAYSVSLLHLNIIFTVTCKK